jgi:hypothetical protein
MSHALMYQGGFETNFPGLKPGARTFHGSDGSERVLGDWPDDADGLRVGYMEKSGKRFVAVRVMDDQADIVLQHELLIDAPSHMGYGKRFGAEPTMIQDDTAKRLLDDIIARNPDQKADLEAIKSRMPWGAGKAPGYK